MRDAFGGVFMIRLFLVFIFIYVAFSAVSVNYAQAFKVKNKVIDFIEQNEITDLSSSNFINKLDELDSILKESKYHKNCTNDNGPIKSDAGDVIGYCQRGVVIILNERKNIEGTDSEIIKYQIITYADWNMGSLTKILSLAGEKTTSEDYDYVTDSWSITGEATVVAKK